MCHPGRVTGGGLVRSGGGDLMSEDWGSTEARLVAGFDSSRRGQPGAVAVPQGILIGYARCSTERQDLTAQRRMLSDRGVPDDRVYLDHGLTGRNRSRPGLTQALAALREGDTLVVPKLERLARSVPDARAIGDSLAARGVRLSLGGTVYDPADPMGKCFFNILATFAEFEVDLLRMRTPEGMAIARAKGKLKGKPPKLSPTQRALLLKLHKAGEHTIAELAELFSVSRATVYRELARNHSHTRAPSH
jgi:DNA invertase Pin-like site-specific DNA recombinase